MSTPLETYKSAQKTAHHARHAQSKALYGLGREDRATALEAERRRVLRGTVTQSVDVDFEITNEDLADLGYHKNGECFAAVSGPDSLFGNVEQSLRNLMDWHEQTHGLTLWSMCIQAPCSLLDTDFRSSR